MLSVERQLNSGHFIAGCPVDEATLVNVPRECDTSDDRCRAAAVVSEPVLAPSPDQDGNQADMDQVQACADEGEPRPILVQEPREWFAVDIEAMAGTFPAHDGIRHRGGFGNGRDGGPCDSSAGAADVHVGGSTAHAARRFRGLCGPWGAFGGFGGVIHWWWSFRLEQGVFAVIDGRFRLSNAGAFVGAGLVVGQA